jgi:phospholipase C
MGYYARADIPFQFALAEAFTICDAYHCSVTSGTDPNRVALFSGSSFDPNRRANGVNCTDADSEPNNLRCWIKGALPEPGYTYAGSAFDWPTIPDVLEGAGVSWRIYQDPNNNFTGAMHGGLAFASFRAAKPGSPLYEKGMRHWSLDQLARDVRDGRLPRVSWILPSQPWSEHPDGSTPVQGAAFTARILDALTANPEVWSKTVLFLNFDENDGYFDHVPPPAPPSYAADGTLAGAATLDLRGMYFFDPAGTYRKPDDTISGALRPWGLGTRVPMYVISPWSKGGWVCSQVFDHTSIGQFIEKRFGVVIPAISPWHRAVCGDLTTALDFAAPGADVPQLPSTAGASDILLSQDQKPSPEPPAIPSLPRQEPGVRPSRPLPYELHVDAEQKQNGLALTFSNAGRAGAVFHVYDRNALTRIPRRYTVEAGKMLTDVIPTGAAYALSVYGPNGFLREFVSDGANAVRVMLRYDRATRAVVMTMKNSAAAPQTIAVHENAYGPDVRATLTLPAGGEGRHVIDVRASANWYDFTATAGITRWRFAGRLETGRPSTSDPEIAAV